MRAFDGSFMLFKTTYAPQYKLKRKMYDYDGNVNIDEKIYKLYGDRCHGVKGDYIKGSLYLNGYKKGRFVLWRFAKISRGERTPDFKGKMYTGTQEFELWGRVGVNNEGIKFIHCKHYILDREMNYRAGAFRISFTPRDFSQEKF